MRQNISGGVNLQTYTTVRKVDSGPSNTWLVRTDRGTIACAQVVHATNAYSAAVEPALRGVIRPTPHMCNKVVPPACFSGSKALRNSYGVLLPDGALFSINPRCTSDGNVLFGGSNPGQHQLDQLVEDEPQRCVDDSLTNLPAVTRAVKEFAESDFAGWIDAVPGPGQLYDYSWSGIIGRVSFVSSPEIVLSSANVFAEC
jgi:glycine/D-amino acid oxidase-like deaminating enzyme